MTIATPCPRCGLPFDAPSAAAGTPVRCPGCGEVFGLRAEAAPTEEWPIPAEVRDETVSRSMLTPMPRLAAGPPDEMIGRLEPGSLRWLFVSAKLSEFLGAGIEGLRGRSFLESLHDDDRALAEDEFRQAGERGERHDFVLRLRGASGEWHYVRIHTQARYKVDGRLDHIRANLKDVTDRIRAEQELRRRTEQLTAANEQLRQANRRLAEAQGQLVHSEKLAALGTLAAGMAHEINNPLAFATNNVAVLERDVAGLLRLIASYGEVMAGSADRAAAEAIESEIDLPYLRENLPELVRSTRKGLVRVAQIVANLRGFARLDRAEVGDLDVDRSLEQCLDLLGDVLAQRRIEVVRQLGAAPPLECAPAHVNQVFLNLLLNALQAIEATDRPSGRIRVATRRVGDEVVVEVEDDGCGIAPEILPKIFDPFFTTKPVGSGTGLGLSQCHGIVADHGGRIEVESEPGRGSTFRVYLPDRRAGGPAAPAPAFIIS
jgi:PAS domain S-box-containing protein